MKVTTFIIGIAVLAGILYTAVAQSTSPDLLILSEDTTVSLRLPITDETAKTAQVTLMEKSAKVKASKPLVLVLNSPGGSIDAGLKLIETAKGLPQKVDTLSLFSASMSFITSQYLNTRYVMGNSTVMSHRAYVGGVEGQIPGSFISRSNFILNGVLGIEGFVAQRAGLSLPDYQKLIANELWMHGQEAVDLKMADKVVRVRCDSTLQGPGEEETLQVLIFRIHITYHKCPLITEPMAFSIDGGSGRLTAEADHIFQLFLNDKPGFIREYVVPGKVQQYIK